MIWAALKNKHINWRQNYSCSVHEKFISWACQVHQQGAEAGDCRYQCSLCQKIEYRCGEQEGSGCQLPGEDDLTSQLPPSVILSSQWCMDVTRHRSPSRTSRYHRAEECYGETMADCDPCYGMTKLHEGGGERNGAQKGGGGGGCVCCFFFLFNITMSAVLWWHRNDYTWQECLCGWFKKKACLDPSALRNVRVNHVYWQHFNIFQNKTHSGLRDWTVK